jgi:hypothetical protein
VVEFVPTADGWVTIAAAIEDSGVPLPFNWAKLANPVQFFPLLFQEILSPSFGLKDWNVSKTGVLRVKSSFVNQSLVNGKNASWELIYTQIPSGTSWSIRLSYPPPASETAAESYWETPVESVWATVSVSNFESSVESEEETSCESPRESTGAETSFESGAESTLAKTDSESGVLTRDETDFAFVGKETGKETQESEVETPSDKGVWSGLGNESTDAETPREP